MRIRFKKFLVFYLVSACISILFVVSPLQSANIKPSKTGLLDEKFLSGDYWALVIGINEYSNSKWDDLQTAKKDAEKITDILIKRYGFSAKKVISLYNEKATRRNIIQTLKQLSEKVSKDDNLFIYYAGHGYMDNITGYWVPSDARDEADYIANSQIRDYIKAIDSSHTFLVSDSCFSGSLFSRSTSTPPANPDINYYKRVSKLKSRQGLTSGWLEPVTDSGYEGHSIFAYYFIKALEENNDPYLLASTVFDQIKIKVARNAPQTPIFKPLQDAKDEGGEFIFLASKGKIIKTVETEEKESGLSVSSNPDGARVYIDGTYKGISPLEISGLKTGEYSLRLEKDGYNPWLEKVMIREGEKKTILAQMEAIKQGGEIIITTKPEGAKVYVDGFYESQSNCTIKGVKEDSHELVIKMEGYKDWKSNVRIGEGESKNIYAEMEKEVKIEKGMVFIKGGCFEMGDNFGDGDSDEKPVHTVCVDDFYLGETEVTVGQFREFVKDTGYRTEAEKGDGMFIWTGSNWEKKKGYYWDNPGFSQADKHPVVGVSWNDAMEFINWLSRRTGKSYRLPTEAEWEYAARSGGKKYKYSWGNGSPSGNIADESAKRKFNWSGIWDGYDDGYEYTAPVGSFRQNELGLYDMTGNVWEWCADWYDENYYKNSPKDNPKGSSSGGYRVLRGGSWFYGPRIIRASDRNWSNPVLMHRNCGFRLAQ